MSVTSKAIAVEDLYPMPHQGVHVITTELLAAVYGTEPDRIRRNHSRNADRFVEGKHFFKLVGDDLKSFRTRAEGLKDPLLGIATNVNALTVWTERGAARHAKMLETDQAWEVFEKLEDAYFERGPVLPVPRPNSPDTSGYGKQSCERFVEECERLGFRNPEAFAEAIGWPKSKLFHYAEMHALITKDDDFKRFLGQNFDLKYWFWGTRQYSEDEMALLYALRTLSEPDRLRALKAVEQVYRTPVGPALTDETDDPSLPAKAAPPRTPALFSNLTGPFFDALDELTEDKIPWNHSRAPNLIAFDLMEVRDLFMANGIDVEITPLLCRALKTCEDPVFQAVKPVNSALKRGVQVRCWVFEKAGSVRR
ncbi:ORF6N domain-containing protein [Roseospira marina]|uniref:ORF6N domain-containing protein n=1 Tax=Roseospira marina TaxID=140057 RepID=A0A5M6I6Z2_9PROT|nr:ORF6N domain-containing protein [Roseospira marina]KAA5604031.1 ORF6N domain-containing protein [Roseospira marina]MBB4315824.1 hypothetical protein [Roseospira marina]MBB5089036.1 hypothetical protein [Roseospira marina]